RNLARWPEAHDALNQTEQLIGTAASEDLVERVRSAWRDLLMAEELDRIRQVTETMPERGHGEALIPTSYDRAFQEYGLNVAMGDRNDLIRHIAESEIRQQFIVALDYWAINAPSDALQQRLTAITRAIDPDPWRNRVRTPGVWKDRIALADLAA